VPNEIPAPPCFSESYRQEVNGHRNFLLRPNFALTPTQSFRLAAESGNQQSTNITTEVQQFNLREATGSSLNTTLPDPGKIFMIYTAVEILNRLKQIPHGFINHTTWEPQSLPLVALEREIWELTINNLDSNGHPFHLVRLSLHPLLALQNSH
jgi:FtsP/CotA-like multicopper oxidase with cupredoxin domain